MNIKCFFKGHQDRWNYEKKDYVCERCGEREDFRKKSFPEWWERNSFPILFLTITILVIFILIYLANLGNLQTCIDRANQMNLEYSFGFWKGCMIKVKEIWIPLDQYIIVK